jgi:electron transfer flavoprotein beta subunit
MRIVVSLKVVPDYEQVRMAPGASAPDVSSVARVMYAFDELALEAALKLKDADASHEIVVVSLTSDAAKVKEVVKKALAMGADRAVIVEEPAAAEADSWAQAQILKAAIDKLGGVDLLVYGIPGIQGEQFPAGAEVAGLLDWPAVSYASAIKLEGNSVAVERHIEKGKQHVTVNVPAVVTVGKFPTDARLPNFKGIMAAKNKPLETWTLAELGLSGLASSYKTVSYQAPPARGAGRKVEGEPSDTAKEAVTALRGKQFI